MVLLRDKQKVPWLVHIPPCMSHNCAERLLSFGIFFKPFVWLYPSIVGSTRPETTSQVLCSSK